ncbi:MAG: MBL fold hydrolase [Anaerolineaceae bacterium]|nr:MBL fold hydrolase [Anaerolineaceae bacterium]
MKVITLDLRFRNVTQALASFLVFAPSGPVLIETGPVSTVARLEEALSENGLSVEDIKHVLVTHLHLDHSGAAGWFSDKGATIYIHWRAAKHLVDPSRLLASAARIYGNEMHEMWGRTIPVSKERIYELRDGEDLLVNDMVVSAVETRGHANHHHVLRIGDIAFMGDAAGIRMPGSDFVTLPAPPPEFDLESWQVSLAKIRELNLKRMFCTHFGVVDDVDLHIDKLVSELNIVVGYVKNLVIQGLNREAIIADYVNWYRDRAYSSGLSSEDLAKYETANPFFMSVDGIIRYMNKMMSQEN